MAVKEYDYNSAEKLTNNFCISEFRCKCGTAHNTKHDAKLSKMLQKLIEVLGADKAVITSGYRCAKHDKAVGGTGAGQHVNGLAADVIFYKGGKAIDTRKVACKAQDLGFKGIGRISDTAIHLDVRTSGKWYGDETVKGGTVNSVTTDFYSYYGISREYSISNLQKILNVKGANLTVDGIAGTKTLKEVKKYIIEQGDSGTLTKWVQGRLEELGYYSGAIDGIAGSQTMKAINTWQKENNLGVGYLGGSDWNILLTN